MSIDIHDVLGFISSADADAVGVLFEATRDRDKALRRSAALANSATLQIGDMVVLDRLSPKYLNGQRAKVTGKRAGGKIEVEFDQQVGRYRAGSPIGVPAGCLTKVES